jgi:hypothetical protein
VRVFLDANVLFSASKAESNVARLVRMLVASHEVVTSELARDEARRNLQVKRPAWVPAFGELMVGVEIVASARFSLP